MKPPYTSKSASRLTFSTLLAYAAFHGLSFGATFVGQTIGVNFQGRNAAGGGALGIDSTAGVLAQQDWNNISYPNGGTDNNQVITTSNLLYDDGLLGTSGTSSVSITVQAADSWNSGSGNSTPNHTLMDGIIKANGGNANPTFSFSGLSAGSYRVLVYTMENGGGGTYSLSLGGTTYYQNTQDGSAFGGTFVQAANTTPGVFPIANYADFNGVISTTGTLSLGFSWLGGSDGVGIAGIQLQTLGLFKTWSGSVNGSWDTTTANFSGLTFSNGDLANFADVDLSDVPVVTRNITVDAGGITVGAFVVNNSTGDYTFGGGAIGGTGGLNKSGTSDLYLNTSLATLTGGTTVSEGTVHLGHATDTLADGEAVTVSGGGLALGANSDTVGAVTLISGSITGSGGVLTGASYSLQSGSVSAILGGAAAVNKTTAGTVALTGVNTYTGGTNITGGVLQANDGVGLTAELLSMNGGVLGSSANFVRPLGAGTGNVQLTGGASGFSADGASIIVSLGGLATPASLTWGDPDFNPSSLVLNASTADSTLEFRNSIDLNGANRTINVSATAAGATATLTGALTGAGGSLTKTGTGTLILGVANSYGGDTAVNGGTLRMGVASSIVSGSNVSTQAGGALDLNSHNLTLTTLSGSGGVTNSAAATTSTLTLSDGNLVSAFATGTAAAPSVGGHFDDGDGITAVVKNTAGALSIQGAGTYSGGTVVNAGTVNIGDNAALGTGPVTLAGGTTLNFAAKGGLVEGLINNNFNTTAPNPGNLLVATTTRANSNATGAFPDAFPNDSTIVYSGFINNPGAATNWTFAENFDDSVLLKINGVTVLNDGGWNNPTLGTVAINPGYNSFELRLGQGGGGVGPSNQGWFNNGLGVGVDYSGAGVQNAGNYVALPIDDGSGNAFAAGAATNIANAVTLTGNATINVGYNFGGSGSAQVGSLAVGSNTLNLTGTPPFATINSGATTVSTGANFNVAANVTFDPGALNDGAAAVAITKSGAGLMRIGGTAASVVAGSSINVAAGSLAFGGTGSSTVGITPFGSGSVTLQSGTTLRLEGQNDGAGLLGQYYASAPLNVAQSNPNFATLTALNATLDALTPAVTTPTTTNGKLDFNFSNDPNDRNGAPFDGTHPTQAQYGFANTDNFQVRWTGYINVTNPGLATFQTSSDDGTVVFINDGDTPVVNNNFFQGFPSTRNGTYNFTSAGYHKITIGFYEGTGGAGALIEWAQAGAAIHTLLNSEVVTPFNAQQNYANNVDVVADASIAVSNSLNAGVGVVSIGASTLTVSSPDITTSPYSLSAASTTLTGNAIFNVGNSTGGGAGTFDPNVISGGANSITKLGSGILRLDQDNTYSGGTNVNAGTLLVANAAGSATGSGLVTVQTGGKVTGDGTIGGDLSILSTGVFEPGTGLGTALNIGGNVTIAGGTFMNYTLGPVGATATANIGGTLTLSGAVTLNLTEMIGFGPGAPYVLATAAGGVFNTAAFTLNQSGPGSGLPGITVSVISNPNQLVLNATNQAITWTGLTDDQWDNTTLNNWTTANPLTEPFLDGYSVTLDDSGWASTSGVVSIGTLVRPFSTTFNNTGANDYVILGEIGGPGGITKLATSTAGVILTGTNSYLGDTTILGGYISIGDDANLGAVPAAATPGKIVLNGGTLTTTASFGINANRGIAVGASVGTINVEAGNDVTYGGVIANVTSEVGVLTKIGDGSLSLGGNNTFTGGLNVDGGKLIFNAPAFTNSLATGSALNINPGTQVEVNNTNLILNNIQVTITDATLTFTGGNHNHFAGSLTLDGATVTTTGGATAFDGLGNYSIDVGTVNVLGATGNPSLLAANTGIHLNGSPDFVVADATGNANPDLTISANLRNNDANIADARGFTKSGPGQLLLTGTNTYTGTTTVNDGLVTVGDGGLTGTLGSGPVVNNTAIVVNRTGVLTIAGNMSGAGTLTKNNTGATVLTGENSGYSGDITVNGGTLLAAGNETALGTGKVTLTGASALALGGKGLSGFGSFQGNGGANVSNNMLVLTTNGNDQARSAFHTTAQTITNATGFTASFLYTADGNRAADGATFTIQNSIDGASALGGGGGAMGYEGIGSSAAIALNIYPFANGGIGTNLAVNGAAPGGNPFNSVAPVALAGGNPIRIDLNYDGLSGKITQTLTDIVNGNTASQVYTGVDLEALLGGTTGFVGFTAATGGANAIQTIRDFVFVNEGASYANDVDVATGATAELHILPLGTDGSDSVGLDNLHVLTNATLNITAEAGGVLTLDSLVIDGGSTVTITEIPTVFPLAGAGESAAASVAAVPEPGSVALLMFGAIGLLSRRRRAH